MVEMIQSIATSGLNGASMMMTREERLKIVKKKEERSKKSKTKEKEWHVLGNSAVDCRKECCWSNQFLPCLCSNAAWRVILREPASGYYIADTLVYPFLH